MARPMEVSLVRKDGANLSRNGWRVQRSSVGEWGMGQPHEGWGGGRSGLPRVREYGAGWGGAENGGRSLPGWRGPR